MELKQGSKVFLDTAPIIYFIEENPIFGQTASKLFSEIEKTGIEIFTSVLTLVEVLTMPYKTGREDIAEIYKDFFYNSKGFNIVDINSEIAELTAKIRAKHGFKTPDAVQLAAFAHLGCDLFVTNDLQLKKYDETRVALLSEIL